MNSPLALLLNAFVHAPIHALKHARKNISARYIKQYSGDGRDAGYNSANERESYIRARFPATYAVCHKVLGELFMHLPQLDLLTSLLDIGCGPGTASFAAIDLGFKGHIHLLEQDAVMHHAAMQALTAYSPACVISGHVQNAFQENTFPSSDIVILSYVLGEMTPIQQIRVLDMACKAANQFVVIINPGTSQLFPAYTAWRQHIIASKGTILTPCPSHGICPLDPKAAAQDRSSLSKKPGWCHFKTRVQRTKEMMYLKEGTLNFEDEPYNYLIVDMRKNSLKMPNASRIMNPPRAHKGHVVLDVCGVDPGPALQKGQKVAASGHSPRLREMCITKSHPAYKKARKLKWGDGFNA